MRWTWSEQVRDTRLPGAWAQRLDTPLGWRLRRWASPWQPLLWLATGTPPSRVGYAAGPLLLARRCRQRLRRRPVRLCLLEGPVRGPRFSPVTAYWVNERSRVAHAVVDDPEGADVVWVHTQDPVPADVRAWLEQRLADVEVPVLNRLEHHDAYHRHDTFRRLRDGGVPVPDPDPAPGDLVVVKGPGQASRKTLEPLGDVPPGSRAFGYVDTRDADGLHRRYRAFHWLGVVHAGDVVGSRGWEAGLSTLVTHAPTWRMTDEEERAVRRTAEVLGLDWFCVDLVRRAGDGRPFVTDVNVYPTPVVAEQVDAGLRARGRWHFLDTAARLGVPEPQGPFWPRFDAALLALAAASRAA